MVYSLTDYRLKQKRPDLFDHHQAPSIIHPPQDPIISSTILNSTTSLSMDDQAQDNKRLTSKWLMIDEIHVSSMICLDEISKRFF